MNDDRVNVCAMAKRFRAFAVAEDDGTVSRETGTNPKNRRHLIFTIAGRSKARAEAEAIDYAKRHGGTVFGPDGERIAAFGPVRYA